MHLAFPPRKNSNPAQYKPRTSRLRAFRRSRLKYVVLCSLGIGAIIFLLLRLFGGSEGIPLGTPAVVVVTLMEPSIYSKKYLNDIKENREEYAKRHGKILQNIRAMPLSAIARINI
jgi:mannan polymerase II complex MNN11 subunit